LRVHGNALHDTPTGQYWVFDYCTICIAALRLRSPFAARTHDWLLHTSGHSFILQVHFLGGYVLHATRPHSMIPNNSHVLFACRSYRRAGDGLLFHGQQLSHSSSYAAAVVMQQQRPQSLCPLEQWAVLLCSQQLAHTCVVEL
jgi:hypothetical protein